MDRETAANSLQELAAALNYAGYIETVVRGRRMPATELGELFAKLKRLGYAAGAMQVSSQDDVWAAIRQFFRDQAQAAA